MNKENSFLMKCPQCGLIYPATTEDIQTSLGSGRKFVPCPRKYTLDQIQKNPILKTYCTGYPEYPQCCYDPE